MLCEVRLLSKLSSVASATVTTPVLALIGEAAAGIVEQAVGDRAAVRIDEIAP